jgi:AcrR family transcriptional regulator
MHATADPGQARARILDAAAALFAELGFDGTSTARIAHTAAVPKGLLFYYFPTKPAMLSALLDERLGAHSLDPVPLTATEDPEQTLVNVADGVRRDREASHVLREIIWHEAHTHPEVRDALTRYRHALHDTITKALTASLPAPANGDAVRAAALAWAATITARPLEASDTIAQLHAPDTLHAIARLLVAGILAPVRA